MSDWDGGFVWRDHRWKSSQIKYLLSKMKRPVSGDTVYGFGGGLGQAGCVERDVMSRVFPSTGRESQSRVLVRRGTWGFKVVSVQSMGPASVVPASGSRASVESSKSLDQRWIGWLEELDLMLERGPVRSRGTRHGESSRSQSRGGSGSGAGDESQGARPRRSSTLGWIVNQVKLGNVLQLAATYIHVGSGGYAWPRTKYST